jgi:hypothetical protein
VGWLSEYQFLRPKQSVLYIYVYGALGWLAPIRFSTLQGLFVFAYLITSNYRSLRKQYLIVYVYGGAAPSEHLQLELAYT